jgi:uncharacterized protein (DUF433 family)
MKAEDQNLHYKKQAKMKKRRNQHVVKRSDGWAVRGEGNNHDTVQTKTQKEAIAHAREIAMNQESEVVIHRSDGTIRKRHSFGYDIEAPRKSNIIDESPGSKRPQMLPEIKDIYPDRIIASPDVLHGKPRIVGTRIMVYQILDLLSAGKTVDEIISEDYFPDIVTEDVYACLEYASLTLQNKPTNLH